jgi:RNA polymerase sigma-70 factor (ECF subfamily)
MDNTDDDYFVNSTKKVSPVTPDSEYNHKDILKTVESLNDECKIPFQMHFDGYKYKEIADELNMPIGTVKSRIFLARKKLTDALKDFA